MELIDKRLTGSSSTWRTDESLILGVQVIKPIPETGVKELSAIMIFSP